MGQLHISLAAEKIGSIFGLPVTNSILTTWLVMIVLILFAFFATRNISQIPDNLQSIAEFIIDTLYNLFKNVVGEHSVGKFFPLLATIFFFIIVSNWIGLVPGVGTIMIKEPAEAGDRIESAELNAETAAVNNADIQLSEAVDKEESTTEQVSEKADHTKTKMIPLFRGATADLNTTLAIAIVAMSFIQFFGFQSLGISYLSKFFNFSNPINFFVGILELVSEFSKIISFAFRLFGNIFAGEVLLTVIAFLMPLVAPLPFLGLELFVGFIQALVFAMLTSVFLKMATISHEGH